MPDVEQFCNLYCLSIKDNHGVKVYNNLFCDMYIHFNMGLLTSSINNFGSPPSSKKFLYDMPPKKGMVTGQYQFHR